MLPNYPPKLSLANLPTEFRPLDRVSELLAGPRIWLKCDDQTGSLVSGNKIRKLEFLMADAKAKGCDTVLTCGGMQSNHCRATAAVAARLGLKCHLILRGPKSQSDSQAVHDVQSCTAKQYQGNLLLDDLCGAEVSVYPPTYYFARMNEIFDEHVKRYQASGHTCYTIPTGGSNGVGLWGYIEAARELVDDFSRSAVSPSSVVCATGSAGTQGGLSLGFQLLDHPMNVIGMAVCDSVEYFDSKIREDVKEWQTLYMPNEPDVAATMNIHTLDRYIGPGYAMGYPELFECIRWLAKNEGVVLDPVYTGKAFYGLTQEIKRGRFDGQSDVVFVHTGGIYGIFPFNEELKGFVQ
ncbi:D-cysteine desulfhydrase family protein [Agarilytica rhodophyticola]|uniref:D-cysteine desulfhydrase family protein n=1 Tax=Agarilytica rhodophyticola TaxID=1737490 RepID=UPI00318439A0